MRVNDIDAAVAVRVATLRSIHHHNVASRRLAVCGCGGNMGHTSSFGGYHTVSNGGNVFVIACPRNSLVRCVIRQNRGNKRRGFIHAQSKIGRIKRNAFCGNRNIGNLHMREPCLVLAVCRAAILVKFECKRILLACRERRRERARVLATQITHDRGCIAIDRLLDVELVVALFGRNAVIEGNRGINIELKRHGSLCRGAVLANVLAFNPLGICVISPGVGLIKRFGHCLNTLQGKLDVTKNGTRAHIEGLAANAADARAISIFDNRLSRVFRMARCRNHHGVRLAAAVTTARLHNRTGLRARWRRVNAVSAFRIIGFVTAEIMTQRSNVIGLNGLVALVAGVRRIALFRARRCNNARCRTHVVEISIFPMQARIPIARQTKAIV